MRLNKGRLICFSAFKQTLTELQGKQNISEIIFRDTWLKNISKNKSMTNEGWYNPPPHGMAVLFSNDINSERINFKSLRDEKYAPKNTIINWNTDFIYAYASNIQLEDSLAGDFGVLLYFGNNSELIEHFKNCYAAVKEVLSEIENIESSVELFNKSQEIFKRYDLQNCIVSYTDAEPLDLGHTIPTLKDNFHILKNDLSEKVINYMRLERKFINSKHDWKLNQEEWFTVEPRLKSLNNIHLPQISFHYLVSKKEQFQVMNECDSLYTFL